MPKLWFDHSKRHQFHNGSKFSRCVKTAYSSKIGLPTHAIKWRRTTSLWRLYYIQFHCMVVPRNLSYPVDQLLPLNNEHHRIVDTVNIGVMVFLLFDRLCDLGPVLEQNALKLYLIGSAFFLQMASNQVAYTDNRCSNYRFPWFSGAKIHSGPRPFAKCRPPNMKMISDQPDLQSAKGFKLKQVLVAPQQAKHLLNHLYLWKIIVKYQQSISILWKNWPSCLPWYQRLKACLALPRELYKKAANERFV